MKPRPTPNPTVAVLAWAAVAAQALFVAGWLVAGAIEGHGYSVARHDISDLAALTAHHAWIPLASEGIAGAVTIAFAVWALRPSLAGPGLPSPVSALFVALSLPALDDLGDVFFRLDCRAADAGCSMSKAAASWHGKAHLVVFAIAALATVIAPFALAHRMQRLDTWRDAARPTRLLGTLIVAVLLVIGAFSGTAAQGAAQRVGATFVCLTIVALALNVRSRTPSEARPVNLGAAVASATTRPAPRTAPSTQIQQ